MKRTLITAHSGCEGTPDNSRGHLAAAAASGCEMLEIDIHGAHGGLYLSHDPSDPAGCLTFDEFLDLLRPIPGLRVNCDMKEDGLAAAVMEAAKCRGMADRIVFTGSAHGEIDAIRARGGEYWYGIWETEEWERALAVCRAKNVGVINLPKGFVTPEVKADMDARGIELSAWTANSEEELRRLLTLGIYNVTTRRPTLALQLRDAIQGKEKENV